MSDEIQSPQPVPALVPSAETSRLDRIEARLAALEDRVAGAGAALPPPPEAPVSPGPTPTFADGGPVWLGQLNDFVRNNPVLTLIGVVIVIVVLSHLFD